MASIGQLVSYIPQTVYLNGATIRDNVAFFSDERDIDNDRVIECLKCAQIWEDVQDLPDGIDTLIGENGTAISGGQRQRIALARALYKEFELLVMDEATAALDIDTERAVIDSIRRVKEGKTLLMVTHHMSLANECDIIYKIERKKLVLVKETRPEHRPGPCRLHDPGRLPFLCYFTTMTRTRPPSDSALSYQAVTVPPPSARARLDR